MPSKDGLPTQATVAASAGGEPHTVELVIHGPCLSTYAMEILQGVLESGTEAGVTVAVSVRPRRAGAAG